MRFSRGFNVISLWKFVGVAGLSYDVCDLAPPPLFKGELDGELWTKARRMREGRKEGGRRGGREENVGRDKESRTKEEGVSVWLRIEDACDHEPNSQQCAPGFCDSCIHHRQEHRPFGQNQLKFREKVLKFKRQNHCL